ncbi:hypothetical protein GA0074692_2749 [Micromonospora pallida]|uniref:Uncharacterized protein n=1 Tax=Micromonospora pallida TaxID=145854 RepID=A0A1C6SJ36_9ACTN|nr:hypothetical protein GA0074692_2749 [Micromonospora pallida]
MTRYAKTWFAADRLLGSVTRSWSPVSPSPAFLVMIYLWVMGMQ